MAKRYKKKVVAVVGDLMFSVKINDAAKRAGLQIEFVKSQQDVMEKAEQQPSVIILDLSCEAVNPLELITELKANAHLKGISLIGYLSHSQGELKRQAHDAGCDIVMTRSAFSQNLAQILKRHSGSR